MNNKSFLIEKNIIILIIIIFMLVIRFFALENSPPGYYVDESAGSTHILTFNQTHQNYHGEPWPIFSEALDGGYTAPTYLYSGVLWIKIFGSSIYSFRALSSFFNLMTILGLMVFMKRLFNLELALWVGLMASLSPWGFQFARIAWDPPLAPCFLIWGLFFVFCYQSRLSAMLSGILLSLSMYSYPSLRIQVILLFTVFIFFKKSFKNFTWKRGFIALTALLITSLPLISDTISDKIQSRFSMLSIFSNFYMNPTAGKGYLARVGQFITNMGLHFNPYYLFLTGDSNLRHSTGYFGILSWTEIFIFFIALIMIIYFFLTKKYLLIYNFFVVPIEKKFFCFALVGYIFGLVPAALTWESLPHALRSVSAWPFLSILSGMLMFRLGQIKPLLIRYTIVISIIFVIFFVYIYFFQYPTTSSIWFDEQVKIEALKAKETNQWSSFDAIDYPEISKQFYRILYQQKPKS